MNTTNAKRALVYNADTGFRVETYDNTSYAFLKETVDGFIEHVSLAKLDKKNIDLWINEEGKLRGDYNPVFALTYDGKIIDFIFGGDVVFLKYNDDGESLPLGDDDIDYITDLIDNAPYIVDTYARFIPCLSYDDTDDDSPRLPNA